MVEFEYDMTRWKDNFGETDRGVQLSQANHFYHPSTRACVGDNVMLLHINSEGISNTEKDVGMVYAIS